jgi:hypothetical protein
MYIERKGRRRDMFAFGKRQAKSLGLKEEDPEGTVRPALSDVYKHHYPESGTRCHRQETGGLKETWVIKQEQASGTSFLKRRALLKVL